MNSENFEAQNKSYGFTFLSNAIISPQHQDEKNSIKNIKRDSAVVITQSDMHKNVFMPMDKPEVCYRN